MRWKQRSSSERCKRSPLTSLTTPHLSIIHTSNKRVLNIVERKRPISVIREVMKTSRARHYFFPARNLGPRPSALGPRFRPSTLGPRSESAIMRRNRPSRKPNRRNQYALGFAETLPVYMLRIGPNLISIPSGLATKPY